MNDLSTDHFIMALKRFFRRGRPQRIYSDNGTNFVGANNELLKCLKQLNWTKEKVQNFCAPNEIEWNFQPPSAPTSVARGRG